MNQSPHFFFPVLFWYISKPLTATMKSLHEKLAVLVNSGHGALQGEGLNISPKQSNVNNVSCSKYVKTNNKKI